MHSTIEIGIRSKIFGTKTTRVTGLVNAGRMVSPIDPFFVEDWVEIAALRLDGAAATWDNAVLFEVCERKRVPYTWDEFRTHMIARFE